MAKALVGYAVKVGEGFVWKTDGYDLEGPTIGEFSTDQIKIYKIGQFGLNNAVCTANRFGGDVMKVRIEKLKAEDVPHEEDLYR